MTSQAFSGDLEPNENASRRNHSWFSGAILCWYGDYIRYSILKCIWIVTFSYQEHPQPGNTSFQCSYLDVQGLEERRSENWVIFAWTYSLICMCVFLQMCVYMFVFASIWISARLFLIWHFVDNLTSCNLDNDNVGSKRDIGGVTSTYGSTMRYTKSLRQRTLIGRGRFIWLLLKSSHTKPLLLPSSGSSLHSLKSGKGILHLPEKSW